MFPGASRRGEKTPHRTRRALRRGREQAGTPVLGLSRSLLLLVPLLVVGCDPPERSKGDPVAWGGGTSHQADRPGAGAADGTELEGVGSLLDVRHLPASWGLDSTLLASAVERARGQSRLHNMVVARHGEVILERHFRGPQPHQAANVKSVSKTLLSAVVGYALAEGVLEDLETPVGHYFPDYLPSVEDDPEAPVEGNPEGVSTPSPGRQEELRRQITLAHLLSMSSGLESTSIRNYGRWVSSPNWVRAALTRPMNSPPGTRMVYSTGNSHLLSAVLTRASGRTTHALARSALSEPAGIQLPPWPRDPQGIYFGGNDMLISPRDLLRFGEVYRQGGTLDGREVLPREWVEESWRIRIHSPRDGNGYGLGWWARTSGPHEVRFAWGYGGQFLFIVPALELTVVFTSDPWASREGNHLRVLHDLLDDFLVPAAERGARG